MTPSATRAAAIEPGLPSTGERFIPGLGGTIELEHLHRYLFARQACAGKTVLDIACGEGYGSAMLGEVAASVLGVDIAEEAVAHARKCYSAANVSFRRGDCASMPVDDASVDVVVSFETIEHHDRHESMMSEIRRVLKPDGVLILSSPERFEYSERPGTNNEFHVHELYRDELMELVGRFFRNVEVYDQKVLFGSAILAEASATRSWSMHADRLHERKRGLVRPLYLITVASDATVAPFETGVFEQELAQTAEWKWWIDTLAQRDGRIQQLDALTTEQQVALVGKADLEKEVARVTSMVHAVGADRDGAQRKSQEALAQIAELQHRLLAAHDAAAARETSLERALAVAGESLQRERAVAEETLHRERAVAEETLERERVVARETLERERAVADEALQREMAARDAERLAILDAQRQAVEEGVAARHALEIRHGQDRAAFETLRVGELQALEARFAGELEAVEHRLSLERAMTAHLRQRAADLAEELARSKSEGTERAAQLAAVGAALATARDEAVVLHADAAAAGAWGSTLAAQIVPLRDYAAKLEWVLSTTEHALEHTTARAADHEEALEDARASQDALQRSTSWRVTAPLRAMKNALRALARAPRTAAVRGVGPVRSAYRRLPIDTRWKAAAKDRLFHAFGFALQDTRLHRDWVAFHAQRARETDGRDVDERAAAVPTFESSPTFDSPHASAPPPLHDAAVDDRVPTPIPQLAEEVTVMTDPPTLEPTYSAGSRPLWVADGTREWTDLGLLRERIATAQSARALSIAPQAMEMADVGDDLEAFARGLSFARPAHPRVTILIPVYDQVRLTLECLASIARAQCRVPFEIVVADDASTDETATVLASIEGLVLHRNARNLHFLRNCNAALPSACGDYVVFLNNDVQVRDWWLDEMLSIFDRHDAVGAVGPKILYPSGHLQEAGVAFNVDMTVDMVGLHDDPQLPRYNYVRRVDYSSGACLMVPRPLLVELGGFSEDFAPAYCEDGDLCLRIRERGLFIYYAPQAVVIHRLSATTAAESLDAKRRLVANNLVTFAEKWQERVETEAAVRTIAFYLPQFYPFPENDRWWGKGFTEWANVSKAQPNFVGHYQPHLPADLGFYDLRVARTMDDQADLARRYGLGGFCFYYYWFAGKRLLDLPVERLLETGQPAFPFCLCWANENWTRRWDGQESHVLMAQSHSDADDEAVIRDLMRFFASPNYIRIDGRPLLVVYRVTLFPDFARTAARWRDLCRAEGIGEIYLSMVESFELVGSDFHPSRYGCDATVEFPPQGLAEVVPPSGAPLNPDFAGHCVDYRTLALRYCNRPVPAYTRFRGAMPGWDNTSRRQDTSYVIEHSTPGGFQAWLEHIVDDARKQHFGDERIVFVNAWNEWAEGAHLEPDRRFGHTYLEALRNAKDQRALIRLQRYVL